MSGSSPLLDALSARVAETLFAGKAESSITPVQDLVTGECGALVESPLERVLVLAREAAIGLADVTSMRRMIARVQARRALLYVPCGVDIANPVQLLATLSKIQILRLPKTTLVH